MATETLNNIAILSQKRQEQVSYFNVSHARRTDSFMKSWGKLKLQSFR